MAESSSPIVPEDGCFWRAVDPMEAAIFEDPSRPYGLGRGAAPDGLVELFRLPSLDGKLCARFFCKKKKALDWAKAQGEGWMVLRVVASDLKQGEDFEVWPQTLDIILDGAKAREFGALQDPDSVS